MKGLLNFVLIAQEGAVPGATPPAGAEAAVQAQAPAAGSQAAPAAAPVHDAAAQAGQGQMWQTLIFFGVMILVFWLLIIRPQQKQRKKQEEFLKALKAGDRVVLASGLIGRIASLQNDIAVIELDKDVRVKVLKSQIATQYQEPGEARS
ncbi:preprotein translocase subunit YajC [Myxococcota bacterium]|nr:preprotein translocase subunit YajC [Myxococcota bacterium]